MNIVEELREDKTIKRKLVKSIINNDLKKKERLYKESEFLNETEYTSFEDRYLFLLKGINETNCKCPYCSNIRRLNLKGVCDTCSSDECQKKHRANARKKRYERMSEEKKEKMKEKMRLTCIKRYGVEYAWQSDKVKAKSAITKEKKYGDINYNNRKKAEKTLEEKYGVKHPLQNAKCLEKMQATNIKKYGCINVFQNNIIKDKIKKTNNEKYGVDYPMMSEVIKNKIDFNVAVEKQYLSKKKNKTLHTSKVEDEIFKIIKDSYPDAIHNYIDERYANPDTFREFHCDFYIPSKDLFIEYQGIYHHGSEPFDEKNEIHLKKIKEWQKKSELRENSEYSRAILVWTKIDVLKRNVAKKNNLKFLEIWNKNHKVPSKHEILEMIKNYD